MFNVALNTFIYGYKILQIPSPPPPPKKKRTQGKKERKKRKEKRGGLTDITLFITLSF